CGFNSVLEAERAQRLDGIGRKPDAGADLGKLGRLLADNNLGALTLERERRREPAADNQNAWHPRHLPSRSNPATVAWHVHGCQSGRPQTRDADRNKARSGLFGHCRALGAQRRLGLDLRPSMLRSRFDGRTRSSTTRSRMDSRVTPAYDELLAS